MIEMNGEKLDKIAQHLEGIEKATLTIKDAILRIAPKAGSTQNFFHAIQAIQQSFSKGREQKDQ